MEAQSGGYEIPEYRCSFCNYAFTTYLSKATHEDKGKCKNKKLVVISATLGLLERNA